MRTRCELAAVAAIVLAGCHERPQPLVICHNSNCAEPQDPADDDTLDALRRSLALLGEDGTTPLDGIELDLLRHAGSCLFAHDADHAAGHAEITEGASVVAEYLTTHSVVSHGRAPFVV